MMKMLMKVSVFNLFSNMSGDVWGMLIYHHWCLGRDLEPSVIKFFSEKNIFSRRSGNGLNGILALSDRQTDASGVYLGLFLFFSIFFLCGRHNKLSF